MPPSMPPRRHDVFEAAIEATRKTGENEALLQTGGMSVRNKTSENIESCFFT